MRRARCSLHPYSRAVLVHWIKCSWATAVRRGHSWFQFQRRAQSTVPCRTSALFHYQCLALLQSPSANRHSRQPRFHLCLFLGLNPKASSWFCCMAPKRIPWTIYALCALQLYLAIIRDNPYHLLASYSSGTHMYGQSALANAILALTAAILLYMAITDFRHFKITNELVLLIAGLFAAYAI